MGERPGAVTEWPAWLLERFHPEHEPGTKRPSMTDNPARAALMAAGYHCYGTYHGHYLGATIYQRREDGIALTVAEYPPLPDRDRHSYELEAYTHDDRDAVLIRLYSYNPEQLAANLPDLERRALAMMRAGREG